MEHAGSVSAPRTPRRRVLLIAYHYPPCQESSGHLRTLGFSRYLPEFGWDPIVLTASIRAYSNTSEAQCAQIPASVPVRRAFALDARKHLSVRHKYPACFAVPDRWSSWWLGAVPAGLSLINRYRPDVIWATQPILTAFWIADTLRRRTGLPWVADFRDPVSPTTDSRMAQRARAALERRSVTGCARAVFTTPGAARHYAEHYPDLPSERWSVIPNGYDEPDFAPLDEIESPPGNRPLRLVHGGILYPVGRNPEPLFKAVARLVSAGKLSKHDLEIVLRASGDESRYGSLIDSMNIGDIVKLEPVIPYRQALEELRRADGLLIFQGREYNGQIPAKIYEYMRVGRPIFALTDGAGDTAAVLRQAKIDTVVPIDDADKIAHGLMAYLDRLRKGTAPVATEREVARHTRRSRASALAALFDEVVI